MRFNLWVAVSLMALAVAPAGASECGEQIRVLDDRYSLGAAAPAEPTHAPATEQATSSGSSGAPSASAGLDTVPNTGGIANPRNTPVEKLDAAQREQVRAALAAARRADEAGDGTTCAAKVSEARRIAQVRDPRRDSRGSAEPAAK